MCHTGVGMPSPSQPSDDHCFPDLDSGTLEDLQHQLETELIRITAQYSAYVNCIRKSLKDTGITADDFSMDLLTIPAFSQSQRQVTLLSAHEMELRTADNINAIFQILQREYASFLNYKVFELIAERYKLNKGQEEFRYPEHLENYIKKHNIEEFASINPLKKGTNANSTELVLKFDIELTSRLACLIDLKHFIADILGLNPSAIQLYDIKDGCVVATFLIPTPVAELIFNAETVLTEEQVEEFRALGVLWLKCMGSTFVGKPEVTHSLSAYNIDDGMNTLFGNTFTLRVKASHTVKEVKRMDRRIDARKNEISILLGGKGGAGKSTFMINFLGGEGEAGKSTFMINFLEQECVDRHVTKNGITITITDTEGIQQTRKGKPTGDLRGMSRHLEENVDLFLCCIPVHPASKLMDGTPALINTYNDHFGKDIWKQCVVIFTFSNTAMDHMKKKSQNDAIKDYKQYIKAYATELQEMLETAGVQTNVSAIFGLNLGAKKADSILALPAGDDPADEVLPDIREIELGVDVEGSPERAIKTWTDVVFFEIVNQCNDELKKKLLKFKYGKVITGLLAGEPVGVGVGALAGAGIGACVGLALGLSGTVAGAGIGVKIGAAIGGAGVGAPAGVVTVGRKKLS